MKYYLKVDTYRNATPFFKILAIKLSNRWSKSIPRTKANVGSEKGGDNSVSITNFKKQLLLN